MSIDIDIDQEIAIDKAIGLTVTIPDTILSDPGLRHQLAKAYLDDAYFGLRTGDTKRWEDGITTVQRIVAAGNRIDAAEPF